MFVIKRNGNLEEIKFDKILNRIKNIGKNLNLNLNYSTITIKIIEQIYNNIQTSKIDNLTAEYCISLSSLNYDYAILASNILISNHHKNIKKHLSETLSFSKTMDLLYNYKNNLGEHIPLITEKLWNVVMKNKEIYDSMIDIKRDYLFDYFGFK